MLHLVLLALRAYELKSEKTTQNYVILTAEVATESATQLCSKVGLQQSFGKIVVVVYAART